MSLNDVVSSKCETCGKPADFEGAKKCCNCWEVEKRIDEFIRSPKGRQTVLDKINSINEEFYKDWMDVIHAKFSK